MRKPLFESVGRNQFRLLSDAERTVINVNEENNRTIHKTRINEICRLTLPDPQHGDFKLSVYPFQHTGKPIVLPEGFRIWETVLNDIMKRVPLQEGANQHYVTIDSRFFTKADFLRREGIHADGNFCVDPNFVTLTEDEKSTWGGAQPKINKPKSKPQKSTPSPSPKSTWGGASPKETWGGASLDESVVKDRYVVKEDNSHVKMDWVLPYKLVIPIGDYISEAKGGILTVSSEIGCQGWQGEFRGEILAEGSYDNMKDQLTNDKKVIFESHRLYFMTSNTPHETLMVDKGKRRSFMRITLNHEYQNKNIKT